MSVTLDNAWILLLAAIVSVLYTLVKPLDWSKRRREAGSVVLAVGLGLAWAIWWASHANGWQPETFLVALCKDVLLAYGTMQVFYRCWEWLGLEDLVRDYKLVMDKRRRQANEQTRGYRQGVPGQGVHHSRTEPLAKGPAPAPRSVGFESRP